MAVMVVCGAVLVAALALALRWRTVDFVVPPTVAAPTIGDVARRFTWYCSLVLLAGVTAGVAVIGCGGRLAMRLLAATAGDGAQGRITEADEVVGEITVEGTIGFVLFNGVLGGVAAAVLYLLLRRALPPRWAGGLAFGAGLLVVLGTTVDPLREDNPDFDLISPGWLAVIVFALMALAFGVVLAAFAARLSHWLPLPSMERATLLRYLPVLPIAVVGITVTAVLVLVGVVVALASRWPALVRGVRSTTLLRVTRLVLVVLVVVSLPGALASMADIATR